MPILNVVSPLWPWKSTQGHWHYTWLIVSVSSSLCGNKNMIAEIAFDFFQCLVPMWVIMETVNFCQHRRVISHTDLNFGHQVPSARSHFLAGFEDSRCFIRMESASLRHCMKNYLTGLCDLKIRSPARVKLNSCERITFSDFVPHICIFPNCVWYKLIYCLNVWIVLPIIKYYTKTWYSWNIISIPCHKLLTINRFPTHHLTVF